MLAVMVVPDLTVGVTGMALSRQSQGFTMEQIAMLLGVSNQTIGHDLGDLSIMDKSKPAKTASNPKIAMLLGVSKQTISTDLVNCQATEQSKLAKTARNLMTMTGGDAAR
jgi:DeoR/GlpR family transcriptional regulator of sugar metabolism